MSTLTQESSILEAEVEIKLARATHDFVACEPNELPLQIGDVLEIWISDASNGWSLAAKRSTDTTTEDWIRGLVPRGYYKFIEPEEALEETSEDVSSNVSETVEVDGVSFELATPIHSPTQSSYMSPGPERESFTTSSRILDEITHDQPDLDLFPDSVESVSSSDAAFSMSKAAAKIDQLLSSNPTPVGLPPSSRKENLVFGAPLVRPEEEGPVHAPNLQPLPPTFPTPKRSNSQRKRELSQKFASQGNQLHSTVHGSLKAKSEPGGWLASGAEAWVTSNPTFSKAERRKLDITRAGPSDEAEVYMIEGGSVWQQPSNAPLSSVISSFLDKDSKGSSFTVFVIETSFDDLQATRVERRFSQFVLLNNYLRHHFSALLLPPLPSKRYLGRFRADFVETRRKDLDRWLQRMLESPVLAKNVVVKDFLSASSLSEWESRVPATLQSKRGEQLFDNVVFQDFDLDAHDVEEELGGLRDFVQQQEREAGVATAESQVGKLRQSTRGYSDALDTTARAFYHAAASSSKDQHCWRADCKDCLHMVKSCQTTAEALQAESTLFDADANDELLILQEHLKELTDPVARHAGLFNLVEGALLAYKAANDLQAQDEPAEEDEALRETLSSRCETILQIARAEMDRYHSERIRDLSHIAQSLLASRIQLHQAALDSLLRAQTVLQGREDDSPLKPSLLDKPPVVKDSLKTPSSWTLGGQGERGLTAVLSNILSAASRVAPKPPS